MYDKQNFWFPKLNGLNKITMETTALKLMEEAGELAQAISKFRNLNGENYSYSKEEVLHKIISELLDVQQVCATMTYKIMEDNPDLDIYGFLNEHREKLIEKGYVTEE